MSEKSCEILQNSQPFHNKAPNPWLVSEILIPIDLKSRV